MCLREMVGTPRLHVNDAQHLAFLGDNGRANLSLNLQGHNDGDVSMGGQARTASKPTLVEQT